MLAFDPATQVDAVPEEGLGLPFGCQAPRAASLALIERWTGVTISRDWFYGPKPTWLVTSPLP